MSTRCWNFRRTLLSVGLLTVCAAARAELMADAAQFLKDYDRLVDLHTTIAGDRDTMAADLDSNQLPHDVKKFFADRAQAFAVRLAKAADRKEMKLDLSFKGAKIAKPTPGTGNLQQDATSYINNYDAWVTLGNQITSDVDQIRSAVTANDSAGLNTACTTFFNDHRSRLEKRLQWQSDIKSMKKDVSFKGTGKPGAPPGTSLKDDVSEFLADRAAWDTLEGQLDTDRNNLRAALSAPDSLTSTVNTFLTDRRAHRIKGLELMLDRRQMLKDVGLSSGKNEVKPDALASAKDLDSDDPDNSLEGSADTAGEK